MIESVARMYAEAGHTVKISPEKKNPEKNQKSHCVLLKYD